MAGSPMPLEGLGFVGSVLDRAANHRGDAAWLAARRGDPKARLIRLHGDKALVRDGELVFAPAGADEMLLLGEDAVGAIFAAESEAPLEGATDLRSIAVQGLVPPPDQAILAQARSMLLWHQRHRFCANCGAATEMADAGYRRHCAACEVDHFPRTDPVIIIVVRHADRCLLGRQSSWPPGMYSALAGFMEPGETIEEAARREVFEESGVRVGAVRYVQSQPWPFPSSLMIGLIGEAVSAELRIDQKELEDARWFPREELIAMREGTHAQGFKHPVRMAIAHHLFQEAIG